jgi:3-isopropylmalate/(R)-2-methylmalate dehydratase small subunit
MAGLQRIEGIAAVLMRDNIDTDVIIASRDITSPSREGYGNKLFGAWRYEGPGGPERADFVLNQGAWRQARILLAGHNFGCGSSREMAVWALAQFGIRCIVAPSFGAIFRNNCIRNGLLPVELPMDQLAALSAPCEAQPGTVAVDLQACTLRGPDGVERHFTIDSDDREMLLTGLDAIERTWQHRAAIEAFEAQDRLQRPWIWNV